MLTAVFIPSTASLFAALQTPSAQRALDAGMRLFTNGRQAMLMPEARPGWVPMAVKARQLGETSATLLCDAPADRLPTVMPLVEEDPPCAA